MVNKKLRNINEATFEMIFKRSVVYTTISYIIGMIFVLSIVYFTIIYKDKSLIDIFVADVQEYETGIIIMLIVPIFTIIAIAFSFSFKISHIISGDIKKFSNLVRKIASGNYENEYAKDYKCMEIKEMIYNLSRMSNKIKNSEEKLENCRNKLKNASREINIMISTLNESKDIKKDQYMQIMRTLVNFIEIKDEYTAGHSKNVTHYAKLIATRLSEKKELAVKVDVEKIEIAALLHDIGKISIDSKILNKPDKLTEEEFEIIKTHPEKGYYALREIDNLKEEREMVRYHHERYDGRGYPKGLEREEIPLGARIITVADSFDAMVSDRPYRKGMPIERAIEQLIIHKGTQFDSQIVEEFLEILKENKQIYDSTKECAPTSQ